MFMVSNALIQALMAMTHANAVSQNQIVSQGSKRPQHIQAYSQSQRPMYTQLQGNELKAISQKIEIENCGDEKKSIERHLRSKLGSMPRVNIECERPEGDYLCTKVQVSPSDGGCMQAAVDVCRKPGKLLTRE